MAAKKQLPDCKVIGLPPLPVAPQESREIGTLFMFSKPGAALKFDFLKPKKREKK